MFPDVPEDLSALSDDELTELHDQLVAAFNEATGEDATINDEDVAALATVADNVEKLRTEQNTRAEAAAARSAQLAELASRVNKKDETPAEGEGDAEGETTGEAPSNQDGQPSIPAEGPPAADTGQRTVTETGEPAANPGAGEGTSTKAGVTAGATLQKLQRNAPVKTRPRPEAPETSGNVSIVASASSKPLGGLKEIAQELSERHRTLGRGNEDNVPVVTFSREMPSDRYLGQNSEENMRKLEAFDRTPQGITAAGGLCAPVNSYYGQMVIADTARPVADSLANFGADRGGIRFNPPPKLSQITSGVGTVTAAQDLAGGGPANKNCFTVTCPTITEVDVTAVYNCLTFGNFGARAFPEQVEAWTKLALALSARTAEQMLLDGIAAASTTVTTAGLVGAGREVLARMGQAAAGYRSRNRMNKDAPLTVLLPQWVADLVQADLSRTFSDEPGLIGLDDNEIQRLFGVRGLNVGWYMDSKTGGGQVFGQAQGGQTYTDGTTSGTTNWSSATAAFTAADVGRSITGTNIAANTTIASVTNATTIVLSQAVTSTTGSGTLVFTVVRPTLAQFPTTVYGYLFAQGSFLHLDAGTLDLGLVRDSTLNTTNQFRMFTESFENVALVGPESLEVVMTLNADGSYGAAKTVTLPINT